MRELVPLSPIKFRFKFNLVMEELAMRTSEKVEHVALMRRSSQESVKLLKTIRIKLRLFPKVEANLALRFSAQVLHSFIKIKAKVRCDLYL